MQDATFSLVMTPSLNREMFSGSVDAGFILALPLHHGDLEPDCAGVSTRGGLMCGIKISLQDFMPEEVGHCMLPYIRDQILELVNESLLVAVL